MSNLSNNKIKVVISGLNQLYRYKSQPISNYYSLLETLIKNNLIDEKIKEIISTSEVIDLVKDSEKQLLKENTKNSTINIKKEFIAISINLIKDFLSSENIELVISHDLEDLYNILIKDKNTLSKKETSNKEILNLQFFAKEIDKYILSELGIGSLVKILSYNELLKEIKEENIINNIDIKNKYVISHESLNSLIKYHHLNCWINASTELFYSYFEKKCAYVDNIIEMNRKQIDNKSITIDFQSVCFYQNKNYYDLLLMKGLNTSENLVNLVRKNNTVIVLAFFRILPKVSDYTKQHFLVSDEICFYKTHLGGDDYAINGEFDIISPRITDFVDLVKYEKLYSDVVCNSLEKNKKTQIPIVINPNDLDAFLYRESMTKFLIEFTQSTEVKDICNKYKNSNCSSSNTITPKLKFPKAILKSIQEVNSYDKLKSFLSIENLSFPLIVKYNSNNLEDNHLLTLIVNDKGLKEMSSYYNKRNEDKDLKCVFQTFINHRGKFIKTFSLNYSHYIVTRNSIPDIPTDINILESTFPKGYINFKTKDLQKLDFLKQLNPNFNEENYKNNMKNYFDTSKIELATNTNNAYNTNTVIEDDINISFMEDITRYFTEKSNVSLVSLDFIANLDAQEYYILDCNAYPGYKEFGNKLGKLINYHYKSFFIRSKKIK